MDLSLEYVNMCQKAKQIGRTELLSPHYKDYYYVQDETGQRYFTSGMTYEQYQNANVIAWLPRQDQLLGLLGRSPYITTVYYLSQHWYNGAPYLQHIDFNSGEQMILAYVMCTKFQRVWDGSKWVKGGLNNES